MDFSSHIILRCDIAQRNPFQQNKSVIIYMIDSDRRPVSNRRPLLKSASTDVIISNHSPILGYPQICVLSKLLYLQVHLHDQSLPSKIIVTTVLFFLLICYFFIFCVCFLSIFPFFNIINRGRIYFGGPWKSNIVINRVHDP